MIMAAFNRVNLRNRLVKLDSERQIAFGAACCERLLPNYVAFQRDAAWGNFAAVRNALDYVWLFLNGQSFSMQEIKEITHLCESAAPNSDDFASLYVTAAQDACFSVCGLLDYLIQKDVDKIVQVATYATDSVDLYVQEIECMDPNDPKLEQKILTHRLMQRELARQENDLQALEAVASLSQEFLGQLKTSWNNGGKSNLDLP